MRQEGLFLGLIVVGMSGGAGFYAMSAMRTPHADVPAAAPIQSNKPDQDAVSPAAAAVAAFYDHINAKEWSGAFAQLSPSFRGEQTVDKFKSGYATTKSVDAQVDDEGTNSVPVHLTAVDVYANGATRTRKFSITWAVVADKAGRLLLDHAKVITDSDSNPQAGVVAEDETPASASDDSTAEASSRENGTTLSSVSSAVRAMLTFIPAANSTQYPDQNIATLVENACGASDYVGSSDLPGTFTTSSGAHGSTNVVWTLNCGHRPYGPKFSFNISEDGEYLRELSKDTCLATHDRAFQDAMESLVSPHQADQDERKGTDCYEAY